MNNDGNPRISFFTMNGQNWLQRIVLFLLAAVILVLAFFFLTIALIAGTLLAAVIGLRWWWLARKLRASSAQETFEGEYVVIEHARLKRPAHAAPPEPRTKK